MTDEENKTYCHADLCDCESDTEESSGDAQTDDENETEERPISLDMTHAEALTFLHLVWEKEIEYADKNHTIGLAHVVSDVGKRLGKQVYNDDTVEWLEEREEKTEEAREKAVEALQNSAFEPPDDDEEARRSFQ